MVVATMSVANSTSIDVYWLEDQENAFALTIFGTGLNAQVTTVSPSGQWSLWSGYTGRYDAGGESPVILFNHRGEMTWMADPERPLLETKGYIDWSFNFDSPILVSEQWADTVAAQNGWHGVNPFTITSFPDITDPSTWTWIGHWQGSGPAVAVPEGGWNGLALCFLLLLPYIRQRWG